MNVLEPPGALRWRVEARRSRRRFYLPTVVYTVYALTILALVARRPHRGTGVAFFFGGMAAWTLLEYFVHRYVLHGRFPEGPSLYRRVTHKYFDPLHWQHHARPWDGEHISGRLRDTLPFVAAFVAAGAFFPLHTGPALVAGLLQAYIIEEWIHHSVHFYSFENRYFRYIKRHHLYHHSPRGAALGFGLTSGFWDAVLGTRYSEAERQALYGPQRLKASPRLLRLARRAFLGGQKAA